MPRSGCSQHNRSTHDCNVTICCGHCRWKWQRRSCLSSRKSRRRRLVDARATGERHGALAAQTGRPRHQVRRAAWQQQPAAATAARFSPGCTCFADNSAALQCPSVTLFKMLLACISSVTCAGYYAIAHCTEPLMLCRPRCCHLYRGCQPQASAAGTGHSGRGHDITEHDDASDGRGGRGVGAAVSTACEAQ